jgi:hypothetical protein
MFVVTQMSTKVLLLVVAVTLLAVTVSAEEDEAFTDDVVTDDSEAESPSVLPAECNDLSALFAAMSSGSFSALLPERWAAVSTARWEATAPVHAAAAGSGQCTIDRVAAADVTPERFKAEYLERRPVILTSATSWTEFAAMTQKHVMLYCFGDFSITLSTANKNSYNKYESSFRYYARTMIGPQPLDASGKGTKYFFGDNRHAEWSALFQHYRQPLQYIWSYASLSFGVGGSGSGVPFHTHGHVFAEVLHGRKRWFLQAPGPEPRFDPDESSLRWAVNVLPSLDAKDQAAILDCVCDPGDMIYIPSFWHHATLNLGETVFMSTFV